MRPRACLRPSTRAVANERGAVLALVALMLIAFLGLAALAIDLGLLYVARGEAQRAADAAAHAGAGWLMHNPGATDDEIKAEAVRVGQENLVRGEWGDIDPDQDIDILWAEHKVRVRVHRTHDRQNPVRTLFAGVIGFGRVGVAASAAAEIWPAEGTECILPLAIADRWCEDGDDPNCGQYSDAWIPDDYDPQDDDDWYRGWIRNPTAPEPEWTFNNNPTGYNTRPPAEGGSIGKRVLVKPPIGPGTTVTSGNFSAVVLPGCQPGARCWEDAIAGCSEQVDTEWRVGYEVTVEPGAMVGPTRSGFRRLIDSDPTAYFDDSPAFNCVRRPGEDGCVDSPRIRPVPVFNPADWPAEGRRDVVISNLVAGFVESVNNQGQATMTFVRNTGLTPMSVRDPERMDGSFQRIIRIVE